MFNMLEEANKIVNDYERVHEAVTKAITSHYNAELERLKQSLKDKEGGTE